MKVKNRHLDLGETVAPEAELRRELMDCEKRELVFMIEQMNRRIRSQEEREEALLLQRRNQMDKIYAQEQQLQRLKTWASNEVAMFTCLVTDAVCVVTQLQPGEERIRVAMGFIRALEVTATRFGGIGKLRNPHHTQNCVDDLCQLACYKPRPGSPLNPIKNDGELYERVELDDEDVGYACAGPDDEKVYRVRASPNGDGYWDYRAEPLEEDYSLFAGPDL